MNSDFKQWLTEQKYYIALGSFALKDLNSLGFESWDWEEVKTYIDHKEDDMESFYKICNLLSNKMKT